MENLEKIIESVVFVAGEPVLISDLCVKFDVKPKQVEKAVEKLKEKQNAQLLALQGVERCSLDGFRLRLKLSGGQTGKPCDQ